jgi:hypothetical protein
MRPTSEPSSILKLDAEPATKRPEPSPSPPSIEHAADIKNFINPEAGRGASTQTSSTFVLTAFDTTRGSHQNLHQS